MNGGAGMAVEGVEGLVARLVDAGRSAGERVVLRDGDRELRGAALAAALEDVPAGLAARGMQPGHGVLFGVRPGIDAFLLLLGAMRAGAVVTFAEPGAGLAETARRLEEVPADWVIAESLLYLGSARLPLRGYLRRRGFELPRLAGVARRHVRVGRWVPGSPRGAVTLRELLAGRVDGAELPDLDPDATAVVEFEDARVDRSGGWIAERVRGELADLERLDAGEDAADVTAQHLYGIAAAILSGRAAVVAAPA